MSGLQWDSEQCPKHVSATHFYCNGTPSNAPNMSQGLTSIAMGLRAMPKTCLRASLLGALRYSAH